MILLTGAKGVVGQPLASKLVTANTQYLEVSRQPAISANQLQWDLNYNPSAKALEQLKASKTLIHCAPIWLLPKHLTALSKLGVERMIVFSSTSVISKTNSANSAEQTLVTQLRKSEQQLNEFCSKHAIALTILRPSMIYGYGRDQNVSHIAKFIKRFGCFLLVGKATGLRQPVHADDLVNVCLNIITNERTFAKTYNLAGAEAFTYRELVERIFAALDRPKRILSIPLFIFRPALILAAKVTRFSYTPEMADRMMQDLDYDFSDARRDFAYQPSLFLENPERDLV